MIKKWKYRYYYSFARCAPALLQMYKNRVDEVYALGTGKPLEKIVDNYSATEMAEAYQEWKISWSDYSFWPTNAPNWRNACLGQRIDEVWLNRDFASKTEAKGYGGSWPTIIFN